MRLFTYSLKSGGSNRVGLLQQNNRMVDLGELLHRAKAPLVFDPCDMLSIIDSGAAGLATLKDIDSIKLRSLRYPANLCGKLGIFSLQRYPLRVRKRSVC